MQKNIAKTWLLFKIIGDILAYIGYTITVTTIYVVFYVFNSQGDFFDENNN